MEKNTLQGLFKKYLDESISPEEFAKLYGLVSREYDPAALDELLQGAFSNDSFAVETRDHDLKEVFAGLVEKIRSGETEEVSPAVVVPLHRRRWRWLAVVACIVLLAGTLTWLWMAPATKPGIAKTVVPKVNDVAPGHDGAILTLANGKQIVLDSTQNGTLTVQGNVRVSKLKSGQLSYTSLNGSSAEILYNKLTTPRARKTTVILGDGTQVWLNAASSIRYPITFAGKERVVEVSGEVYFEVAKNIAMPFIVKRMGTNEQVEVLGTSFNVNAYDDEDTMRTTLLEGSVKVTKGADSDVLRAGQQAVAVKGSNKIKVINEADIDEVMAWKNGRFQFSNMDMKTIMRQLARWYDVDVVFEGEAPKIRIGGFIHKDVNLSTVLEFLKGNGVRYRLEGKKITILQ
jgi:ferric-dicitrate binding protein FerR (iron transport regulator)